MNAENAESREPQSSERSRSQLGRLLLVLGIAALAVFAFLKWNDAEEDPLASMVTAFRKQNSLTVFQAQVASVVTSKKPRLFGLLKAEQVAVIPATVDYKLDLGKMKPESFSWDRDSQRVTVTLPPLVVGTPNLDEGRARYLREGVLISGETQEALTRSNTRAAQADVVRQARNPELMSLARAAAREAMARNVALPLRAAGYDKVTVDVRFADEAGSRDPSYLDRSRRIEDVLKERRAQKQK